MRRINLFCFILFFLVLSKVSAIDTLYVSLQNVDSIFIRNNLLLLAQAYNIDASRALELNAKAYPNPVFTIDLNVYDPQNNIPFHVGNSGQKQFILEQLILIGGKRSTEIEIAKKNTQLAELEFQDLLRTMFYELHATFFTLNQQNKLISTYNTQLGFIDTLVQRYEVQVDKGNVSIKDFTRLESVFFKLNNARTQAVLLYLEELNKMQVMLQTNKIVIPVFNDQQFLAFASPLNLDSIRITAMANRPDFKVVNEEVQLSLLELKLQKKMVIPDIKLILSYDQRGGAFLNQFNAGISLPIPLWNHNRGMVKFSKAQVSISETYLDIKKSEIENDVSTSFLQWQTAVLEYGGISQRFNTDFEIVYNGMLDNFAKRNISMIEFTDFVESYNETVAILEASRSRLAIQAQKINLVTATKLF